MYKKQLTLISLLFFSISLFGQEQIIPETAMYKDDNGKLYINKDLPLYLWLSTSKGEKAQKVRLESDSSKRYSNPMFLDTEGRNTIRTPSAIDTVSKRLIFPIQDVVFEVYADSYSPYTRVKYTDGKPYQKDGKFWINSGTKINFNATDKLSGVANVYVSIDKKPYFQCDSFIVLNDSKEYHIQYYATDNVGNVEKIRKLNVVIDNEAPETTLEVNKNLHNNIISARSSIIFKSEDDISGVAKTYYKLDNRPLYRYYSPIKAVNLKSGEHKLTYYSIDHIGNKEEEKVYDFYIDKKSPIVFEEIDATSFIHNGVEYSSGRSRFKITAIDNKAGIKEIYYSINGQEYKLYEKPFFLKSISGNLVIKTYAVDNVNNKSNSERRTNKADLPYIDLAGPSLYKSYKGKNFEVEDTVFIKSNTKVVLRARDKESGLKEIQYNINKLGALTYTEPFLLGNEGKYVVSYTGYDNVGNTNTKEYYSYVDDSGPEIFIRFSSQSIGEKTMLEDSINVYPKHVALFISCTDKHSGFDNVVYSINDKKEVAYAGPIKDFEGGRDYKVKVTAVDKLGNVTEKIIIFSVSL